MGLIKMFKRNGVYYARYPKSMKRAKISLRTENRKIAQTEVFRLEMALRFGTPEDLVLQRVSYSRAVTEFLALKKGQGKALGTVECYRSALRNFGRFLKDDVDLVNIKASQIDEYPVFRSQERLRSRRKGCDSPLEKSPSQKTIRNEMVTLLTLLKWAEKKGYLKDTPGRRVELPKIQKTPPRFLTYDEYSRLRNAVLDENFMDVLDFYLLTGIRRSEGIALRSHLHVDMESMRLTVPQSKQNDYKILPIVGELVPILKRLLLRADKEGRIIRYHEDVLTYRFKQYAATAGLSDRMTFHVLRHTFGTWLARQGVSFQAIQSLMGHRDPESTKKYVHTYQNDLSPWLRKLNLPKN